MNQWESCDRRVDERYAEYNSKDREPDAVVNGNDEGDQASEEEEHGDV